MTDRNTIIRECIAALPRWPGMGCNIRIPLRDANGPMKAFVYPDDAQAALAALLSVPDQAEASEPLPDLKITDVGVKLSADGKSWVSASQPNNWTPDERTVIAVCDWFAAEYPHSIGADNARKVFLPPDPIAALVDEWNKVVSFDRLTETEIAGFESFTRWLVSEGRLTL